ncbi:MAG: hypothetical protein ABIS92_08605 [Polyangia bacterium]
MATSMSIHDKDAAVRSRDRDEEDVADLLVALRRQIDATEKLIAQSGGLLRELDVHRGQQPSRRIPKR